jgi:hypothetical protein
VRKWGIDVVAGADLRALHDTLRGWEEQFAGRLPGGIKVPAQSTTPDRGIASPGPSSAACLILLGVACRRMKSKLMIKLDRMGEHSPGPVDLAHDLHWVKRDILGLPWTDSEGNTHTLGESYSVGTVRIEST